MSEGRKDGKTKRRVRDDYETPPGQTRALAQVATFDGPILEPACGSGRMMRELKAMYGVRVHGTDIKSGHNFVERTRPWDGDIITNPPYRDGLADAFTHKALELASGKVAMLLQSDFLWGQRRHDALYSKLKPSHVLVLPGRVYFFEGPNGMPIPAQFFNHAWFVWPDRETRAGGMYDTELHWAQPDPDDFG